MRRALAGAAYSLLIAAALVGLACAVRAASSARNEVLATAALISSLSDLCDRVAEVLRAALREGGPDLLQRVISELNAIAADRWGVRIAVSLLNGTRAGGEGLVRVTISAGPYSVSRVYDLESCAD